MSARMANKMNKVNETNVQMVTVQNQYKCSCQHTKITNLAVQMASLTTGVEELSRISQSCYRLKTSYECLLSAKCTYQNNTKISI